MKIVINIHCLKLTFFLLYSIPKIGLGNGHRKSKEFEDFVLTKRVVLRNELKLCEKAAQKLLSYSNNFLHKRMKTDPDV